MLVTFRAEMFIYALDLGAVKNLVNQVRRRICHRQNHLKNVTNIWKTTVIYKNTQNSSKVTKKKV